MYLKSHAWCITLRDPKDLSTCKQQGAPKISSTLVKYESYIVHKTLKAGKRQGTRLWITWNELLWQSRVAWSILWVGWIQNFACLLSVHTVTLNNMHGIFQNVSCILLSNKNLYCYSNLFRIWVVHLTLKNMGNKLRYKLDLFPLKHGRL